MILLLIGGKPVPAVSEYFQIPCHAAPVIENHRNPQNSRDTAGGGSLAFAAWPRACACLLARQEAQRHKVPNIHLNFDVFRDFLDPKPHK